MYLYRCDIDFRLHSSKQVIKSVSLTNIQNRKDGIIIYIGMDIE